jgi:hypothetical protein
MPRHNGDIQTFYNYEIELDDNKYLFRTIKEMVDVIDISQGTISKLLKNPQYVIKKYINRNFKLLKIRKPVYNLEKKIIVSKQLIEYS